MMQSTSTTVHAKRIGPTLAPDCSRVLIRPFQPTSEDIALRIISRVMTLSDDQVSRLLHGVLGEFEDRHEQIERLLFHRFTQLRHYLGDQPEPSPQRRLLIGACFTHEDPFESAALFHPSIMPHPDQTGLPARAPDFPGFI
jgi:hypothetical protein